MCSDFLINKNKKNFEEFRFLKNKENKIKFFTDWGVYFPVNTLTKYQNN